MNAFPKERWYFYRYFEFCVFDVLKKRTYAGKRSFLSKPHCTSGCGCARLIQTVITFLPFKFMSFSYFFFFVHSFSSKTNLFLLLFVAIESFRRSGKNSSCIHTNIYTRAHTQIRVFRFRVKHHFILLLHLLHLHVRLHISLRRRKLTVSIYQIGSRFALSIAKIVARSFLAVSQRLLITSQLYHSFFLYRVPSFTSTRYISRGWPPCDTRLHVSLVITQTNNAKRYSKDRRWRQTADPRAK